MRFNRHIRYQNSLMDFAHSIQNLYISQVHKQNGDFENYRNRMVVLNIFNNFIFKGDKDMACTCGGHNEALFAQLDKVIEQHKDQRGSLISVLHKAQGIFGYLPEEVQAYIAEKMDIPLSEIYGVVTFYALFTMNKKGKYTFNVCLGTACYVKGSGKLLEKLQEELGIGVGETTEDGMFSIECCRCVGACGLAPVITINDKVHGHLVPEDIPALIAEIKAAEQMN